MVEPHERGWQASREVDRRLDNAARGNPLCVWANSFYLHDRCPRVLADPGDSWRLRPVRALLDDPARFRDRCAHLVRHFFRAPGGVGGFQRVRRVVLHLRTHANWRADADRITRADSEWKESAPAGRIGADSGRRAW